MFGGFGGDRFRTALTRACTAAAVPAFSPNDDDLVTTARTYTHVVVDEGEVSYAELL